MRYASGEGRRARAAALADLPLQNDLCRRSPSAPTATSTTTFSSSWNVDPRASAQLP